MKVAHQPLHSSFRVNWEFSSNCVKCISFVFNKLSNNLSIKTFLAAKNTRRYNIPVLSGSAWVGQLYDGTNDQILADKFLWSEMDLIEADITSVETETYIEESVTDRVNHLSVSASLSISLYAGLIKVTIICIPLSGSFYFLFMVFWSKWSKTKKSAVLFIYFLCKRIHILPENDSWISRFFCVLGMSSGDFLIWHFKFWIMNICFLFLTNKKTLTNQTLFFSAESKQ